VTLVTSFSHSFTTPHTMTRILLFGAGAVGAVYVYTFMQAGAEVTAVCRSNYEVVKKDGFMMYSVRFGDVRFRPSVVRVAEEAALSGPWDFVVICSKCFPGSSPSLSNTIKPVVGPSTAIVLVQNGINIEEEVAASYPNNPIISCVVYLPCTQIHPGVIDYGATQKETLNLLELGTYPALAPEFHKRAAEQIAALVEKGGGVAKVYDDIQPQRWSKLVVNASWNPITALSLCSDADFLRSSPGAVDLVRSVMFEVVALARTLKIEGINEDLAERQLQRHRVRTVGKEPSMLTDVKEGRPFEVEAIIGNTVRLAKEHGVKVPLLDALYALAKGLYEAGERSRLAPPVLANGT
jgi:2-dehydropantoate 2-reductase